MRSTEYHSSETELQKARAESAQVRKNIGELP
jgi:hypothetical protein